MGLAAGLTGDSNLGLGWGNVGLRRGCLQVLDPICGLRNAPWVRYLDSPNIPVLD